MKKVLALVLALVLVLSLAACQSEEELQKEKVAVNGALQGGWTSSKTSDSGNELLNFSYGLVFDNGKYYFSSVNAVTSYTEAGTYEIYPKSKEIVCTVTDGNEYTNGTQKTFKYEYDSSTLKIFDNNKEGDNKEYKKEK